MSEEVNNNTIKINDKDYFLLKSLSDSENIYSFFFNINDFTDIKILKEKHENNEVFYISLESESEFDRALLLYYEAMKRIDKS